MELFLGKATATQLNARGGNMESDVFTASACGTVPGNGHCESDTIAPQLAIDLAQACGDAQIYLPVGEYEFVADSIHIEVNGTTSGRVSLQISGGTEAAFVQTDDRNLFVVTDTYGERGLKDVELDGLHFSRNFEPPDGGPGFGTADSARRSNQGPYEAARTRSLHRRPDDCLQVGGL
jgi:hypothetical protein